MSLPQSPSLPKRVFVWFAQAAAYTGQPVELPDEVEAEIGA